MLTTGGCIQSPMNITTATSENGPSSVFGEQKKGTQTRGIN